MAFEPLRINKGYLLAPAEGLLQEPAADVDPHADTTPAATAPPRLSAMSDGVVQLTRVTTGPRNVVLSPHAPAASLPPADAWISLAKVHGVPPNVALRVAAGVARCVLSIHAAGYMHCYMDPTAVFVRQSAFDAAMKAATAKRSPTGGADRTDDDGSVPDVLVGRFPLAPGAISTRALTGPLRREFSTVAPEVVWVPSTPADMEARPSSAVSMRPPTANREHVMESKSRPVVGKAADVWGVAAILANLLSPTPLATKDLLALNSLSPLVKANDYAVASLLLDSLRESPESRPTMATFALHAAFSGARVMMHSSAVVEPISTERLIETLRRRKKLAELTPQTSPMKSTGTRDSSSSDDDESSEDDEATSDDDDDAVEEEEEEEEDDAECDADEDDDSDA